MIVALLGNLIFWGFVAGVVGILALIVLVMVTEWLESFRS